MQDAFGSFSWPGMLTETSLVGRIMAASFIENKMVYFCKPTEHVAL